MLAVDGCPLSCPAKAIPHWWGPTALVRATLVAALLGLLPHQGGTVQILGQRLGPLGQLAPFRARSDRLRAPGPQLARAVSALVRSSWVLG